mmetsp:Transcript_17112/g.34596  ORF Transcript_17112/g.34596 Transcript_17112/m.34596 type:complete len:209 (+) Transcript_17112:992-1618(+)
MTLRVAKRIMPNQHVLLPPVLLARGAIAIPPRSERPIRKGSDDSKIPTSIVLHPRQRRDAPRGGRIFHRLPSRQNPLRRDRIPRGIDGGSRAVIQRARHERVSHRRERRSSVLDVVVAGGRRRAKGARRGEVDDAAGGVDDRFFGRRSSGGGRRDRGANPQERVGAGIGGCSVEGELAFDGWGVHGRRSIVGRCLCCCSMVVVTSTKR